MLKAVFFTTLGIVDADWNEDLGEFDYTGPNRAITWVIEELAQAMGPYGNRLGQQPPVQDVQYVLETWDVKAMASRISFVVLLETLDDPTFPEPPEGDRVV